MPSARDLTDDGRTAGVVLAAGAGRRMGAPKAGVLLGGRTLLARAVEALAEGGCRPVLAVVRSGTGDAAASFGARPVVNPDPDRGMRSSLELAVQAADPAVDGRVQLLVLLVDTPGIGAGAVRAVASLARPGRITLARYGDGTTGHPILMQTALWRRALEGAGADQGGREFLRRHPELIDDVAVAGDPADLDTPDALRTYRGRNVRFDPD